MPFNGCCLCRNRGPQDRETLQAVRAVRKRGVVTVWIKNRKASAGTGNTLGPFIFGPSCHGPVILKGLIFSLNGVLFHLVSLGELS